MVKLLIQFPTVLYYLISLGFSSEFWAPKPSIHVLSTIATLRVSQPIKAESKICGYVNISNKMLRGNL